MKHSKNIEKNVVNHKHISCDGHDMLDHPKIYLHLTTEYDIKCPYCGKKFIYKATDSAINAKKQ